MAKGNFPPAPSNPIPIALANYFSKELSERKGIEMTPTEIQQTISLKLHNPENFYRVFEGVHGVRKITIYLKEDVITSVESSFVSIFHK